MRLTLESYVKQKERWPKEGRHILAQFDVDTVVVYQAYRPSIGLYAAEHGRFGGEFSYSRMSWIKPNFLWMMYRSGWGAKEGQEVVLAIHLDRAGFDEILGHAVPSSFASSRYPSKEEWQETVRTSDVRLQWDPDHDPHGAKLPRRAIQLGLRGAALRSYGHKWVTEIEDISDFVREQRELVKSGRLDDLNTPREEVYPVEDSIVEHGLGLARDVE